MRKPGGDEIRLTHIVEAVEEIENYLKQIDFDQFLSNSMMRAKSGFFPLKKTARKI